MSILRAALPDDSILHHWLDAQSIIETPVAYDLVCGLCILGAVLRRDIWYNQIRFNIWPNVGVMLVGESGVGKDTAINQAVDVIRGSGRSPILNGTTIEQIYQQLSEYHDVAAGVMVAKEMSHLFGPKDYQGGILTGLTDILSSGDQIEIGLKSAPGRKIHKPTVTMFAGSTLKWLHEFMPKYSNEGGFYPRLLIIVESEPKRTVSCVDMLPPHELAFATAAFERFLAGLKDIIGKYISFGRFQWINTDTYKLYDEWYAQRKQQFSPLANAYAHRSRDNVLRLCMLSAVSRGKTALHPEDVAFAKAVIQYIADRIDSVFMAPTVEGAISKLILQLLPATDAVIWRKLGRAYKGYDIERTLRMLVQSEEIHRGIDGKTLERKIN